MKHSAIQEIRRLTELADCAVTIAVIPGQEEGLENRALEIRPRVGHEWMEKFANNCEAIAFLYGVIRGSAKQVGQVQELGEALRDCLKWFDSDEVRTSFDTQAMLALTHSHLAAPCSDDFCEWAESVWRRARLSAGQAGAALRE